MKHNKVKKSEPTCFTPWLSRSVDSHFDSLGIGGNLGRRRIDSDGQRKTFAWKYTPQDFISIRLYF